MLPHRYLVVLLGVACAAPPPAPSLPAPLVAARSVSLASLDAPSLLVLADALDVAPSVSSVARMLPQRSACNPRGGVNPYVHLPATLPRSSEPLRITWSTRCAFTLAQPPKPPGPPAAECWLVWSTRRSDGPIDFTPYGMPGCLLLVRPDNVLLVPTVRPAGNCTVWREGGLVHFEWTRPSLGAQWFAQLLVAAPGETPAGFLASPAIEVVVGN